MAELGECGQHQQSYREDVAGPHLIFEEEFERVVTEVQDAMERPGPGRTSRV
jgi:hypothetical protein